MPFRHFSRAQYVAIVIVAIGASLACLGLVRRGLEVAPEPYYQQVEPHTVEEQDSYRIRRRYSGEVSAKQHADVGLEQGGKLADVLVDQGNIVQQGDVLAVLDTELLRIERLALDARLVESRAKLKLTEANLQRLRSLRQAGHTSEQRLDELETQRATLLAEVARLDAAIELVVSRIRKSALTAPFNGIVTRRFADQGAVVSAGAAVLRLQQQGAMEAHIGVPARLLGLLQTGESRLIELNKRSVQAEILAVGADLEPSTRTVMVRFGLPNEARTVNGNLAYLALEESVESLGFWIPARAVTDGLRGLWAVYAIVEVDGFVTLEARDIQIVHATGDRVFVNGALSDGDAIVAAGLHRLVPGQRVVVAASSAVIEGGGDKVRH